MGPRQVDDSRRNLNQNRDVSRTIQPQASKEEPNQAAVDRDCQTNQEKLEEQRKIRRLQLMMNMVVSVISQDESLTVDQAAELVADTKKAALAMFPDKELAYNLIYKPRLQRLMRERFRIQ